MLLIALLALCLKLKRSVTDAVLLKLLADLFLYLVMISGCNNVHRSVIANSVHAPYVNVMNSQNALNFAQMLRDLLNVDSSRCLFKEKLYRFPKIANSIYKNNRN